MGRYKSYFAAVGEPKEKMVLSSFSFKPTPLLPEQARFLPNASQSSLSLYCFKFCRSQVLTTLFFMTLNSIWSWEPWACSWENPCFQRRGFVAKLAGSFLAPQAQWHLLRIYDVFCDTELGDVFTARSPSLPAVSNSWRTDVQRCWQGTAGSDTPQITHPWDCTGEQAVCWQQWHEARALGSFIFGFQICNTNS